jgi:hypothetical protein
MINRWLLSLLALLLCTLPLMAQGGGQICVRAYEDRNGNVQEDPGEPRITQGLSASLIDETGVIIATEFMEDSPNAASGTLCFQRLSAGQYTLRVTSATYSDTTPNEFITAVTGSGVPQVFSYGGRLIVNSAPPAPEDDLRLSNTELRLLAERLLLAGIGAMLVVGAMAVMGAFIVFLFFRDRQAPRRPTPRPATRPRRQSQSVPRSTDRMQAIAVPRRTMREDADDDAPLNAAQATDAPRPTRSPMTDPEPDPDINPVRPDNFLDDFQFTDDDDATNNPRNPDSSF